MHGLAVHTFDPLLAGDRHKFSGMINAPHNPMVPPKARVHGDEETLIPFVCMRILNTKP